MWSNGQQILSVQKPEFFSPLAPTDYKITLGRCVPSEAVHFTGDLAHASIWLHALTAGEMFTVMTDALPVGSYLATSRYFHQGSVPTQQARYELEQIGMGGMAREKPRPPGQPWEDTVDIVFSVADGSWPYIVAACELLYSDVCLLLSPLSPPF
jgi:hypothetical protein